MACLWLIGLLRIFYHGDWLGHIALVGMLVYLLLAWPLCGRLNRIVTLVVSASYVVTDDAWFDKSFLTSAITVTLCSLWPTLINTAVGVSSIDPDLINVSRMLKLNAFTKVTKIVIPSSLPYIFTGLRLSLGVGWMVLIAAEMLAQNPGLGKFVWDEFQNGSSESLGRIMVAVLTIGIIGFMLDRVMLTLQRLVSHQEVVA